MKNTFIAFLLAGICSAAYAQSDATAKNLSAARSFYATTDVVYPYIDSSPMYPGGHEKWVQFLDSTRILEKAMGEARKQKLPGGVYTITVKFAVNTDGSTGDFRIVGKPIGYGLEEAVVQLVKESGKWTPANIEGTPARAWMQFPIRFTIPD